MSGRPLFVATCAQGLEPLLEQELRELGLPRVRPLRGAVVFGADRTHGYRALLWSRIASRVLLEVARFPCHDADSLYDGVRMVPWHEHIRPEGTLCVDFVGVSPQLRHSGFSARRTKDAIADHFREELGVRPSVDCDRPDLRIHVHLNKGQATVGIDLAGTPLHERGLDREAGPAPLKETLAAALLRMTGWNAAARTGRPLMDPMCGSGTFLLEASMVARDVAPGLHRRRWGFDQWLRHDAPLWGRMMDEARERQKESAAVPLAVYGGDSDPDVLAIALRNLARAGFADVARTLTCRDVSEARPVGDQPGVLLTNPPYGERMDSEAGAAAVTRQLGDVLRQHFLGWHAWILVGSPGQARSLGLRPAGRHPVWNGRLDARLLEVPIAAEAPRGGPRGRNNRGEYANDDG